MQDQKKNTFTLIVSIIASVLAIATIVYAIFLNVQLKDSGHFTYTNNGVTMAYQSEEDYMSDLNQNVKEIREKTDFVPEVGITLGTGLGTFADNIDVVAEVPYWELSNFPVATNPAHEGIFVFGMINGVKVVCMKGRIHYYEGYNMQQVVKPTRLMQMLGAHTVVITNSVGGINKNFHVGDFVVVKDLISTHVPSPIIGPNCEELGDRFISTYPLYDKNLINAALQVSAQTGITVHEGVYLQTTGPHYETYSDLQIFRAEGGDTVGMSSGVEAIAAKHLGMRICNINFVSVPATDIASTETSDEEVIAVSKKCETNFKQLMLGLLPYCK